MKQTVLLCDRKWEIQKILYNSLEYHMQQGEYLTDLIPKMSQLLETKDFENHRQNIELVCFRGMTKKIPVIIHTYPGYFLVFAAGIHDEKDFEDFSQAYIQWLSWADEHIQTLFRDEYYEISQLNNQLLNSKRALLKNNQQLKRLLNEVREANDTIAVLERDDWTNLYNASGFYRNVRLMFEQQPDVRFDMIILNLENYRLVNEIFGKTAGQCLIRKLALFMLGLEHTDDVVFARVAEATFYICAPSEYHFYDILDMEVSQFLKDYPLPIHVRIRMGVYSVQQPEISVEEICNKARLSLDFADEEGSAKIAFYNESLHENLIMKHQIFSRIQEALNQSEFKLYLQSKVDIATGEVVGAEALVRWIHPELGFIPPDKFIHILEKEGYIYAVDKYIWEEVCKILKARQDKGLKSLPISVNVARNDFYEPDLVQVFNNLITKYNLKPENLHLEVLERAYVNDSKNLHQVLSTLRAQGFCIEMDDFGTGESSLAMLADMPVDILKLDRHFLTTDLSDQRHVGIIQFIIDLAKSLDMGIITEGVEEEAQAKLLLSMGCRYAQGYYYCKPQPAAYFLEV